MRAKRFLVLTFFLSILFTGFVYTPVFAQDPDPTEQDGGDPRKKSDIKFKGSAKEIIKQADELYSKRRYLDAEAGYRAAIDKDPGNYHCMLRIAKCNRFMQDYNESIKWFESALAVDPNKRDTTYFELGTTYKLVGRYNDAREMFEVFKKKYAFNDDYYKRVILEIKGCDFAEKELAKTPLYRLSAVDFNSPAGDMFPSILNQNGVDSFIVFMSFRQESKGNDLYNALNEPGFSDLWSVKMEDDTTFGIVENLGKKVNTKNNDGTSAFSPDGMFMYYSICNDGPGGYGCSIYESKYDPRRKAWGKPKFLDDINGEREVVVNSQGKTKDVPTWDAQPSLSPDGNTMFFVSDREGGWGNLDIWYSMRDGEGWTEPINAGPNINTAFDDMSPFINNSGSKLFFATDGRVGMGGLDIYYAEGRIGNWGEPMNIGVPINSSFDDYGSIWTDKDSVSFFSSNRLNGEGSDDIYYAKMKKAPPCVYAVHGLVRDRKTKQPVPFAEVLLFEKDGDGGLIPKDTFTTDQSASYAFPLEPEKEYKIVANAPEYLANEEELNTLDVVCEGDSVDFEKNIDIFLERIEINVPIVLNNIYYDFDSDELRPESKSELKNNLMKVMNENTNITIEIGSHTDSNGSEEYNKELSERRAKSVVEFLIDNNINPARLSWFGYGESQLLIYPELTDEDEQLNRRSEFRIQSIDFNEN